MIPLNYVAENRQLVFETSSTVILDAVHARREIVLEVDEHDGSTAWSVVARGIAHILTRDSATDPLDAGHAEARHLLARTDERHGPALRPSCSVTHPHHGEAPADGRRCAAPHRASRPSRLHWVMIIAGSFVVAAATVMAAPHSDDALLVLRELPPSASIVAATALMPRRQA